MSPLGFFPSFVNWFLGFFGRASATWFLVPLLFSLHLLVVFLSLTFVLKFLRFLSSGFGVSLFLRVVGSFSFPFGVTLALVFLLLMFCPVPRPFLPSPSPLFTLLCCLLGVWLVVSFPVGVPLLSLRLCPLIMSLLFPLSLQNLFICFCFLWIVRSPTVSISFLPLYGSHYWPSTWSQLFFFDLDRPVINWKVAHGVLYTADRLVGFGYSVDPSCFCRLAPECPSHLFFSCPLAHSVLSWLQSLLFGFSSSSPSLVCCHVLFGFDPTEIRRSSCLPVHPRCL